MIIKTPTKFFLVKGSSEGFSLLNAFDGALLASGVGDTNLVKNEQHSSSGLRRD